MPVVAESFQNLEQAAEASIHLSQVAVVIPTYNARKHWPALSSGLNAQGIDPAQVLIVDSDSADGTGDLALAEGYQLVRIRRSEFNHGGTRQRALHFVPWAEVVVFLTQDAVLVGPESLDRITKLFDDDRICAAYGRQLPQPGATPIEAHARQFNYPSQSGLRTPENRHEFGFKAIFISNSFAAYRRDALMHVGGFPRNVIFGEDTITAGRLLLAGGSIAYVAEAEVRHSHSYTWREEFRRYFDIGVMHSREGWLIQEFGKTGGEGKRFVMSEFKFLLRHSPWLIPSAVMRTVLKLSAYRLGKAEQRLSAPVKARLSMHRSYWVVGNG